MYLNLSVFGPEPYLYYEKTFKNLEDYGNHN